MIPTVIIDTDPGVDDAVALFKAFADHKRGDIAITLLVSSGGNLPIEETTQNLLALRDFHGLEDIPVVQGITNPYTTDVNLSTDVHGTHGLPTDSITRKKHYKNFHTENPCAMIHKALLSGSDYLLLGRATNLYATILAYPETSYNLSRLTAMGGSGYKGVGNMGEGIEFNVASDPVAWKVVMDSFSKRGSSVTLSTTLDYPIQNQYIDNMPACPVKDMLTNYGDRGERDTPIHDLITYLLWKRYYEYNFGFNMTISGCVLTVDAAVGRTMYDFSTADSLNSNHYELKPRELYTPDIFCKELEGDLSFTK